MSSKFGKRNVHLVMRYDSTDYVVQAFAVMAFANRDMAEACADKRNERNQIEVRNGDLFADDIWYGVEEVELVDRLS